MGEKKVDNKYIRKYWGKVFLRAYSPIGSELAMRAVGVLFLLTFVVLVFSGILTLLGTTPISFFSNQLDNFKSVFSTSAWTLAILAVLITMGVYRSAAEIDYEKQEIIDNYKPKELNICVEKNLSSAKLTENGDTILHLTLDVINVDKYDILELDAHLSRVDQRTELLESGTVNGVSTIHMGRLQWDNGSYQVELKPGYRDYKKINIATLNCATKELKFIQEKTDRVLSYQENALYGITVTLKGKVGNDAEYHFYNREFEFLCSPSNCILDFRPNADDDPKLPNEIKVLL